MSKFRAWLRKRREAAEKARFDRAWNIGQAARRDFIEQHGFAPGPMPYLLSEREQFRAKGMELP